MQGVLGLDPRTHLAAIALVGISTIMIAEMPFEVLLQVAAAVYLCLNDRVRLAVRCCAFFALVLALSFAPLPGLYGVLFVSLMHMTPPFTVGCALFSLSPSAIMGALSRWHVPPIVRIGVCMMFRFVSLLGFETCQVIRGIRMRGIFARRRDVLLLYVPLVMRSLRLSSELAASAELRGALATGTRSSVYHIGFCWRDAAAILLLAILCAALVIASAVSL